MAKKKKSVSKERAAEPTRIVEIQPTIVAGDHAHLPRLYANWLQVQHTGIDVTLLFGDIEPPTDEQKKVLESDLRKGRAPVIVAKPVAKLVVKPELVGAMIQALSDNLSKLREHSGKGDENDE